MILLEDKKNNGSLGVIHFTGIGGIGMSGIAEILHNLGYQIQGSDIGHNSNTERLSKMGIKIFYSQKEENITNISYVVTSTAIKKDNPEVLAAIKQHIPVIPRAEMLAELMRLKASIAISGSHGKTTTTSMIASLFEVANLKPTVINGGIINNKATNAYLGDGKYLIAEADESDATFIKIPSTIAVITNIDPEHMDYYKDFATLINAFKSFINNLPFYGFCVACMDHPIVRDIIQDITKRKIITYGIESKDAHIIGTNIKLDINSSIFDIEIELPHMEKRYIKNVTIPIPGKHNILNALAAIAVGIELEFTDQIIIDGFKQFHGVKRRFTHIGKYNEASLIDDYAHHPVEIQATLATAKAITAKTGGKVIAICQPHRYSRLANLFDDFVESFKDADKIFILDVYTAGEVQIEDFNSKKLAESICAKNQDAKYINDEKLLANIIHNTASKNDIFIFMGAGNITKIANDMPNILTRIIA